jgi:hypothetical protein
VNEVDFGGLDRDEAANLYYVQTTEWGEQVTRWADDLRAVGRCVAEADAGTTVIIRIPDKPADIDISDLKENEPCL